MEEQVDYAGCVLYYEKSKRNITCLQAKEILDVIHQGKSLAGEPIKAVAVTVSPTEEQIRTIAETGFDLIQIHGDIADDLLKSVEIPVIRAFNGEDRNLCEKYNSFTGIYAYLFDAKEPGSGVTFDWGTLADRDDYHKNLFLAGGLRESNVGEAIKLVKPYAVDVSSSVEKETTEGFAGKDREKIREFVKAVREAAN